MASHAYVRPLSMVTSIKYLGCVMISEDDDCPTVMVNLKKARKSCARLMKILGQEGAKLRVSGIFLKTVVQVVLLFGSETWVMTPCMERALGSFQHRVTQRITGRYPRRQGEGSWDYPPLATGMEEAGSKEIRIYILNNQNKVTQYISMRPILDLCERSV